MTYEPSDMKYIVGKDDGYNYGPFDSGLEALKWAAQQLAGEDTLDQYRNEAEEVLALGINDLGFPSRAKDLVESVDWVIIGIQFITMGDLVDVLPEEPVNPFREDPSVQEA